MQLIAPDPQHAKHPAKITSPTTEGRLLAENEGGVLHTRGHNKGPQAHWMSAIRPCSCPFCEHKERENAPIGLGQSRARLNITDLCLLMPKQFIRKHLPDPETLRQHKSLRFLGTLLSDPNLWHINRHSLAGAAFVGVFVGFLPMPLQMALAAMLAVRFRCNLPLSVVLVWISNPVTWVPMWYFTYRVGAWMLGVTPIDSDNIPLDTLVDQIAPLYAGSIVCGLIAASAAYAIVKIAWRLAVIRNWNVRNRRRAAQKNTPQ